MNPLMQSMAPAMGGINPQAIQQIKQMAWMIQNMQNPQAALMQMAQRNPQVAEVLQMCHGRSPKEIFYEQCKQHGADPGNILSQFRQAGLDLR